MGMCGISYEPLINEIERDIKLTNGAKYEFENDIERKKNSINSSKNKILKEINKDDIKLKEIGEYYHSLNEIYSGNRKYLAFKNKENKLNDLLKKVKNKENNKRSPGKYDDFKEEHNKINVVFPDNLTYEDRKLREQNNNKLQKIKEFYELKTKVIDELEKLNKKKEEFIQKINEKQNSNFISPKVEEFIAQKRKDYENIVQEYNENLNSYNIQIKDIIKDIFGNETLDETDIERKYGADYGGIKNEINNINRNLEEKEKEILKEIDNDIINDKIITERKNQISSKMNDLKNMINQVTNNINNLENKKQEYSQLNELINQKENKKEFISFYIKEKNEKLNELKEKRNILNSRINTLTNQINKINETNNSYINLENLINNKNNNNDFYLNDENYNEGLKKIDNQKNLLEKELNNIENIKNENKDYSNLKKDIEELTKEKSFILYNSQDEENNNEDSENGTYMKFKNKIKEIFNELYKNNYNLIDNIIKSLLNNNRLENIPNIEDLINQIFKNEQFDALCENDLIKELESISKDEEKFKINHLTILLISRKDVEKTPLIKYLLKLNDNEINNIKNNTKNKNKFFIPYTSIKVKYLKIIEVRAIGYDTESTPENIKKKIEDYIGENKNDFNSVIHCIWFCINGTRFQEKEESLFWSLKNIYSENTMPMILIYTESTDEDAFDKMKQYLIDIKIDNNLVEIIAEDTRLINGTIKKAKGNEELLKTTRNKCINALNSNMFNILVEKISNNLLENLHQKYEKNFWIIKDKVINNFIYNYKESLGDGDFIQYITDIFIKNLNIFFDSKKEVSNKSRNLFLNTDFISNTYNIYLSYKKDIIDNINSLVEKKAKELLEIQATFEIENGNIDIDKRKNYYELKKMIEIFLKNNYYFIVQNYIINFIINEPDNYFNNFLSAFLDKIKTKFRVLENLNEDNKNQESIKIKNYLGKCLNEKLNSFYKNNIELLGYEKPKDSKDDNPIIFDKIDIKYEEDENLENIIVNSNSLIFKKIKIRVWKKPKEKILIEFDFDDNKKNNLNLKKMQTFVKKIQCQSSSIKSDKNDNIFNYFQEKIKDNLLEYVETNQGKFLNEIKFNYNNNYSKNNNKFSDKNKIEKIIMNKYLESYFKNLVENSLNDINKQENKQMIKLYNLNIILTGKSGVGKSTLINCLLKGDMVKEDIGNVVTLETEWIKNNNIDFLTLIDSRGYELEEKFDPNRIKDDIIKFISDQQNSKELNKYVHCIWYCVSNCNYLDEAEISALKELKNNKYNIPLVVVYTYAQIAKKVEDVKKQIKEIFSEDIFIPILGRSTKSISEFGLDDLLNKTMNIIKSNNKNNNILVEVKNITEKSKKENFKEMYKKEKENIINKIIEKFISSYSYVKSDDDFETYVCELISEIIQTFSNKNEKNYQGDDLIQSIKNCVRLCVSDYKKITNKNYLDEILNKKSFEFLQLQVNVEQEKNGSIKSINKKNKKGFKELIFKFLRDNFYFIAQKYLIYKFIIDIFEDLAEQLEIIAIKKIDTILEKGDLINCYRNIYVNIFTELEKKIAEYIDDYRKNKKK